MTDQLITEYLGQKYKYIHFNENSIANGKITQLLAYLGEAVESVFVFESSKSVDVTLKKNKVLYDFNIRRLKDYGFVLGAIAVGKGGRLNFNLDYIGEQN